MQSLHFVKYGGILNSVSRSGLTYFREFLHEVSENYSPSSVHCFRLKVGTGCENSANMATTGEAANRYQVLCFDQVQRLRTVMEENVPVHGRGNFPTLQIKLTKLVSLVREKLLQDGMVVKDIRLNGGAASYILGSENPATHSYNDLDLIFGVDIGGQGDLQKLKNAVLNSLLDFLPEDVHTEKMSHCNLKDAYVQKLVKVFNDNDRWSLISLSNNKGRNVELKFVHKMRRQFEFSVDSFQILLDSLLTFYNVSERSMSEHFYPTVVAESVYGDFSVALYHLNKKLIATRQPEQIRGGGLLKYCNLLVHGYQPAGDMDIKTLERYMCSRFFIDFPDVVQQRKKLEAYLANHFLGEDQCKYDYLMSLYGVVDESTICLMGHERRQTLNLIQQLAQRVLLAQEQRAYHKQLAIQDFDNQNLCVSRSNLKCGSLDQQSNLIIDQVYYHAPTGPYAQPYTSHSHHQHHLPPPDQYYQHFNLSSAYATCTSSCPMCPPRLYMPCS